MRRAFLIAALGLVVACRRDTSTTIAALDGESLEASPQPTLADVRTLADVAREAGHRVRVHGVYEIEPSALATKGRIVTLALTDGTRVIRAYAPIDAELRLADRRVVAIGMLYATAPPAKKEALAGPHVVVENIELAPGEKAIEPAPTEPPAPPLASSAPALAARLDRYVQIVGVLESLDAGAGTTLRLADGALVRIEQFPIAHWPSTVGSTITVVGRIEVDRAISTFGLSLVMRGRTTVCHGVVERCGI